MLKKSQIGERKDVERAKLKVSQPDTVQGPEQPLRVDIPREYHKRLLKMKGNAEDTKVTVKLLVIEALEDLFKKYEEGSGFYPMED
ncbi:hypothetical protein Q4K78_004520 [Vibrio parahaemolyticus]|nr:hypothetical protein [Vibrio parahaemolyticus]